MRIPVDMNDYSEKLSAKILVLGDSGVGKSSLIHLICHGTVIQSANWTIGCSIDVKLYDDCFLEFWDIGGSRGHKVARSFLYQDYDGIMLVFDATNKKSRTNLQQWLTEATQTRTHPKEVPIIYIGTKNSPIQSINTRDSESSVVSFDDEDVPVIYVNTRDPHSCNPGSNNYLELQDFYRRILDRKVNKTYC